MHKEEVRDIAREANLYTAEKQESQEICFVPDGKYSEFIDRYLEHEDRRTNCPPAATSSTTVGRNDRRRTPAFTATRSASGAVLGSRTKSRCMSFRSSARRIRSSSARRMSLNRSNLSAKGVNWVAFDEPAEPVRAEVKVRYRHEPAPATIYRSAGGPCTHCFRRAAAGDHARTGDDLLQRRRGRRRRLDRQELRKLCQKTKKRPSKNAKAAQKLLNDSKLLAVTKAAQVANPGEEFRRRSSRREQVTRTRSGPIRSAVNKQQKRPVKTGLFESVFQYRLIRQRPHRPLPHLFRSRPGLSDRRPESVSSSSAELAVDASCSSSYWAAASQLLLPGSRVP